MVSLRRHIRPPCAASYPMVIIPAESGRSSPELIAEPELEPEQEALVGVAECEAAAADRADRRDASRRRHAPASHRRSAALSPVGVCLPGAYRGEIRKISALPHVAASRLRPLKIATVFELMLQTAPPAGFEAAHTAPEAVALSPELWGLRRGPRARGWWAGARVPVPNM